MLPRQSLLKDAEWIGTFYPPGKPELSFGGKITFTPLRGLSLTFAVERDRFVHETFDHLHGHTSAGLAVTLIGNFDPKQFGWTYKLGHAFSTCEQHPFTFLVLGLHCDPNSTFDSAYFDVTGAQDFFAPKYHKKSIAHSKLPIYQSRTDNIELSVIHSSKFEWAPNEISAVFHAEDEDALAELQKAYVEIRSNHEKFVPYLRKSTDFDFKMKFGDRLTCNQIFIECLKIANLFSLMRFAPTKVSYCDVVARDEDDRPHSIPVVASMSSDPDELDLSQTERNFDNLPLNANDINFGELFSNWDHCHGEYLTAISIAQGRGSLINMHVVHASIVLSATQLEAIAISAGFTKRADKYCYALEKFGSGRLKERLATVLRCDLHEIGPHVGQLRNEIAHVGRPRTLLGTISRLDLLRVSTFLEVLIVAHILESLGINRTSRDKFQDNLTSI